MLRQIRIRKGWLFIFAVFFILTSSLSVSPLLSAQFPKRMGTSKPDDCQSCHGSKKVLPASHGDTKGMTFEICRGCHQKGEKSLIGKFPLSHIHQLSGVACNKCHEDNQNPMPLPAEQCLACHGGSNEKLAEMTANVENNPHESPHGARASDCNVCHHQHRKSENYCAKCHKFNFIVP